jgi:hypothetical protein
MPNFILQL